MEQVRNSGKICVAVACPTMDATLAAAKAAEPLADVVEIRLDGLAEPDIKELVTAIQTPLLFTNRASWEGGNFQGSEEERLALLSQAIDQGAAYIDIEVKTDSSLRTELIKQAKAKGASVITSWHNFSTTPSGQALQTILQEHYQSGSQIGKIVTMAHTFQDVLRVLDLQTSAAEIGLPLIAFCMGQAGVISRVATLELGGFMTYAAADTAAPTAPGQLGAARLKDILAGIRSDH